jgi:hypothetical protein
MRTAFAFVLAAFTLGACDVSVSRLGPGETVYLGASLSYSDEQEQLKGALAAAGVPFTIEIENGKEFIRWDAEDAGRARAVSEAIFGPDPPEGRSISYDSERQEQFKAWLSANGIPFTTIVNRDREYVVWEESASSQVEAWPYLPDSFKSKDNAAR